MYSFIFSLFSTSSFQLLFKSQAFCSKFDLVCSYFRLVPTTLAVVDPLPLIAIFLRHLIYQHCHLTDFLTYHATGDWCGFTCTVWFLSLRDIIGRCFSRHLATSTSNRIVAVIHTHYTLLHTMCCRKLSAQWNGIVLQRNASEFRTKNPFGTSLNKCCSHLLL